MPWVGIACTRFQGTPLHYAGKYQKYGVMEELLNNRAGVNRRDRGDMTPLHRTVISHNTGRDRSPKGASLPCVDLLINAGADLREIARAKSRFTGQQGVL